RWSATAWGLVGLGHVVIGVITGAWSTVMLVRKLGNVTDRVPVAMRLAGRGNLHAGRLIASALTRAWWPITLCACLVSRRARRMALIAAVVPNVATWLTARPDVDVLRYVALRVADDVAYGTGVWKGALARRRAGALVPTLD
ncbi:MAG: mycofactocin system glycosyltransferase, partial [Ilumatobacteraceae bacterium]